VADGNLKNLGSLVPECDIAIFGGMLRQASLPAVKEATDKFHGDIHSLWLFNNVPVADDDFFDQFNPYFDLQSVISTSCDKYCFRVDGSFIDFTNYYFEDYIENQINPLTYLQEATGVPDFTEEGATLDGTESLYFET